MELPSQPIHGINKRFANSVANFIFEYFGDDPISLQKSLLIAPLRFESNDNDYEGYIEPSLIIRSLKLSHTKSEVEDYLMLEDDEILSLYFDNLDEIYEILRTKLEQDERYPETLELRENYLDKSIQDLFFIKDHEPKITLGKISYSDMVLQRIDSRIIYYHGKFDDTNKYHGKCIYNTSEGDSYSGEVDNGQPKVTGIRIFTDHYIYEGEFKNGIRHGKGVFIVPDVMRYEGSYVDDLPDGLGILTLEDEERYEGEFKEGEKHGRGVQIFPDGERYEGEFKNDVRHGQGILIKPGILRYEGEFAEDLPNGQGVLIEQDSTQYRGQFRDGQKVGTFHITNPDHSHRWEHITPSSTTSYYDVQQLEEDSKYRHK